MSNQCFQHEVTCGTNRPQEAHAEIAMPARAELLHGDFFQHAREFPQQVALICSERQVTYGELASAAMRIARRLRDSGSGRESVTAIAATDPLRMTAGILGILLAGGAYLPLDPTYPAARLAGMLDDAAARILLDDCELAGRLRGETGVTASWTTVEFAEIIDDHLTSDLRSPLDVEKQAEKPNPEAIAEFLADSRPEDLAYVIFTSGSTGRSKGVMIEHQMARTTIRDLNRRLEVTLRDRILAVSSFSFDLSVYDLFGLLAAGGTVVFPEPSRARDPRHWLELLAGHKITLWNSVPALFEMLTAWCESDRESASRAAASLRAAMLSGDWISVTLPDRWRAVNPRTQLLSLGGATEGSIWSIYFDIERVDPGWASIPYGRALDGQQMEVFDEQLAPCPPGEIGEIHIGGAGVARGYIGRPELTAERFIPDPFAKAPQQRFYRTGDLGRYLPDGNIEFLGRADQQVKIGGYRIELGEIEAALRTHPAIREAVAVARRDRGSQPYLAAYFQVREAAGMDSEKNSREAIGKDPTPADIIEDLKNIAAQSLPAYMRPVSFTAVTAWPLSANGKVDRARLPAPQEFVAEGATLAVPENDSDPHNESSSQLNAIWRETLGIAALPCGASFTALGGDSLRAVTLVVAVGRATGVMLPPTWPLDPACTIAAMTAEIKRRRDTPALAEDNNQHLAVIPRRESNSATYPLSYPQRQLWLADQLARESPCYNVPLALRFTGPLDVAALAAAFRVLIARHESLRTTFESVGGELAQRIHAEMSFDLPLQDYQESAVAGDEEAMWQELRTAARERFDPARGPLFRAALYRLAPRVSILFLNLHHLICDGWTLGLFGRELAEIYRALCAHETVAAQQPNLQAADYALWQRNQARFENDPVLAAYWQSELADLPEVLQLPTDHPRPEQVAYHGATHYFQLNNELVDQLRLLAQQHGTTLFNVLLTAWQILLAKQSGQTDFCLGTPSSGRGRAGLDEVWGYLIHVLALRARLQTNQSIAELLRANHGAITGALAHQDFPFEQVIKHFARDRMPANYPLFPAMIVLEEDPANYWKLEGTAVETLSLDNQTAKFEMLLALMTVPQGIRGAWEYRRDLFEPARIERLCRQWQQILREMTAQPERVWHDLSLLSTAEQSALTAYPAWRNSLPAGCSSIVELVAEQVRRTPAAVAVTFEGRSLTYRELYARAMGLAQKLRAAGVGRDVPVGICLDRSLDLTVAVLAVLQAGGAYVPLDPSLPAERLKMICEDARLALAISRDSVKVSRDLPIPAIINIADLPLTSAAEPEYLPCPAQPEDLAYILYTSGSTGRPKGVAMPHRALVNLILWQRASLGLEPGQRTLQFASLGFDVSFQEIFGTWCAGGTLVLISEETRRDFGRLLRLLVEESVQRVFLPFVALQHLAEAAAGRNLFPAALVEAITAGEQLKTTPALRQFFMNLPNCRLWNHYGPTECHVVTSYRLPDDVNAWPELPPIGRAIDNTSAYLFDPWGQPVPVGVPGEIYLGGACVARGYFNRPDLTDERFVPHSFCPHSQDRLYRTGDYGRWNEAGELEFLGRRDEQIKIRGYRVELGDIEAALRQLPGVRAAVAALRNDRGEHGYLVGYLVLNEQADFSPDAFRSELERVLPNYMIPARFCRLETLPLNSNGKVDRRALPAPQLEVPSPSAEPARNYAETRMLRVWSRVLRQSGLRPTDNYFDLGGDSLVAAQLFSEIEAEFGFVFSLSELLNRPTPRQLTELVEQAADEIGWNSLVPIQEQGDASPLFLLPGIGGSLVDYYPLAKQLGGDRPVFGLQPHGIDGVAEPLDDVIAIAECYWEQIRQVQPRGPYYLAGYSFGGVLAYELAQQIRAAGEEVAMLALVDTSFEDFCERPLLERVWFHLRYMFSGEAERKFGYFRTRLVNFIHRFRYGFRERPLDYMLDCMNLTPASRRVAGSHWQAWSRYRPQPYPGHIHILLAGWSQESPRHKELTWNWANLAERGVTLCAIPGTHENLFKGRNLTILAEQFKRIMHIAELTAGNDWQTRDFEQAAEAG